MAPQDPREVLAGSSAPMASEVPASALMEGASIDRATAILLTLFLLGVSLIPTALEVLVPKPSFLASGIRGEIRTRGVLGALPEIENHYIYQSRFVGLTKQLYQRALLNVFTEGSRTVIFGSDGGAFHLNDLLNLVGRSYWSGADSTAILADFNDRLLNQGVYLQVVVVPAKSTIYPESLVRSYPAADGPALHPEFAGWSRRMASRGVPVLDLTQTLWTAKARSRGDLYLRYDTHWSPEGLELAAQAIAANIRPRLAPDPDARVTESRSEIPEPSDLFDLLGLGADAPLLAGRRLEVRASTTASPHRAPVLLFGDSLTGYYDNAQAGLAQHLSRELGVGVDRVIGVGARLPAAIRTAFEEDPALLEGRRLVLLELQMGQIYTKTFNAPLDVQIR